MQPNFCNKTIVILSFGYSLEINYKHLMATFFCSFLCVKKKQLANKTLDGLFLKEQAHEGFPLRF
jgi:hypothetical protein